MIEWRPVVGFPNYEVSNTGRVRRAVAGKNSNHRFHRVGYEMPPNKVFKQRTGYNCYHFFITKGEYATRRGARLVLEAFVGPQPTPIHVAAHNDGIRDNDSLDNVRWATQKENAADRWKHGTMCIGATNKRAKLTEAGAEDIRQRYARGEKSTYELAAIHGVSRASIAKIINGISYSWAPAGEVACA